MKYGIEVEGRLKGIPSLFVEPHEIPRVREVLRTYDKPIHQICVDDPKNTMDMHDPAILDLLTLGIFITVECTKVRSLPPEGVHVVLMYDADSFQHLRPTDQVKFVKWVPEGPIVWSSVVENMTVTQPQDFDDVTFE